MTGKAERRRLRNRRGKQGEHGREIRRLEEMRFENGEKRKEEKSGKKREEERGGEVKAPLSDAKTQPIAGQ